VTIQKHLRMQCYDCSIDLIGNGFWFAFINEIGDTAPLCNSCSNERDSITKKSSE